jgi:hypothetical protein
VSVLVLSAVACVATFVAGWWLIGDLSSTGIDRPLDYPIVRAPDVPDAAVIAAGVVGLVVVVAILVPLAIPTLRGHGAARPALGVIVAAVAIGFVVAGIARAVTAGSVGSNIGAPLAAIGGGGLIWWLVRFALQTSHKIPTA